jgi:hypothetical protein
MNFPTTEPQIVALANRMLCGYFWHAADFPHVPNIFRLKLLIIYNKYTSAQKTMVKAFAALRIATKAKNNSLQVLKKVMKQSLQKSQVDVAANPEKLKLIGWGLRDNPHQVQPPGQPTNLQIIAKDNQMIKLKWDSPTSGQRVRNFVIERRQQNDDGISDWRIYRISYGTQISLTNQLVGVHLEYRVKAVNIAGQSSPSNIAAIVL